MSNLALPPEFAERVKAKIGDAVLGLITDEQMTAMVEAEIKKFFDPDTKFFIEETITQVENPNYSPHGYNSEKFKSVNAVGLAQRMSPFAIMVWTAVHKMAKAKLDEFMTENGEKLQAEYNEWFAKNAEVMVDKVYANRMAAAMQIMSNGMFATIAEQSHFTAVQHVKSMLRTASSPNGQVHGSTFLSISDPTTGEKVL